MKNYNSNYIQKSVEEIIDQMTKDLREEINKWEGDSDCHWTYLDMLPVAKAIYEKWKENGLIK